MPAETPDRATDLPAGAPARDVEATTDRSRGDTSTDPDRTRDHPPGSVAGAAEGPEAAAAAPTIPGYEIEGVLGRGGMGVVYRARHLALKRTVALKMILVGGHAGPRELARFRTEAEAVARLQHPNIVQIHEVGEAGGHPYCALEFVEGENLAARIDGTPLPAGEAARLVEVLARAVQLAHTRNVVHRDLKPANILLTADGTPKITDFGLARQLDSDSGETMAGAVMGTPSYMAPEQASGYAHEAGPAADVYALGAILYTCLTGRPPFRGKTTVETLDEVRTREPAPPSRSRPGVPLDLETVCLKCLRKQPENRYASAAELADDLARYRRGEPTLARPVGNLERVWKWVRRNPGRAAAVVAAVLVAVGAGVAANEVSRRRQEDRLAAEQQRADDRIEAEKRLADERATRRIAEERAKDQLELAQDRADERLARTWLGPLAETPAPNLNDGEIGSFAALAAGGNNRVEYRFVAEALDEPRGRRKLRARAAYAMQAVVGLDEEKRLKIEQLLADRLERLGPADDSRADVALAAAGLGSLSPRAASAAGRALQQSLTGTTDPAAAEHLALGLSAVAAQLEPAEAAASLTQAMTATQVPGALRHLALGVAAVGARLEPAESARVSGVAATTLTRAIADTNSVGNLRPLVLGLAAVTGRLEPTEAAKVAAVLGEAKARPMRNSPTAAAYLALGLYAVSRPVPQETGRLFAEAAAGLNEQFEPEALKFLSQDLSEAVARLGPEEAAEVAGQLTRAMTVAPDHWAVRRLGQVLSALSARLEARAAAKVATTLARAAAGAKDTFIRDALVQALSSVPGGLDPKDAAEVAATLTQAMTKPGANPFDVASLGLALSAVAPGLEPGDASKVAATLTQIVAQTNDAFPSEALALAAVAVRLEPKEAAGAAATLAQAFGKYGNPSAHHELVRGLTAVVARLEPEEATRLAAGVAARIKQAAKNDPNTVACLARCLPAMAAHLEPGEAAEIASSLTQTLAVFKAAPGLNVIQPLTEGLSAVARRMEPGEAARLSALAADTLKESIRIANTNYPIALPSLARSLSAVAARMPPEEDARACEAAALLMEAVPKTSDKDPDAFQYRLQGLSVLAGRLTPKAAAEAAARLTQVWAKDGGEKKETGVTSPFPTERVTTPARVLSELLGSGQQARRAGDPRRPSDQDLVELLKRPFCVGPARRAVLDQLQHRHGRAFIDQWEFVRFAKDQNLGLVFTRPQPPATGSPNGK